MFETCTDIGGGLSIRGGACSRYYDDHNTGNWQPYEDRPREYRYWLYRNSNDCTGPSEWYGHQSNECVDTVGRYHGSAYFTCSEPPSPPSTDLHTLGVEIEIEVSAAPASQQASIPIPSHLTPPLPSFSPLPLRPSSRNTQPARAPPVAVPTVGDSLNRRLRRP